MGIQTEEELVVAMYEIGLQLFVGEDGVVHGKLRSGGKLPLEAWALVEQLRLINDAVAGYLRERPITTLIGITGEACCAYGDRVKSGELRIVGKVAYHKNTELFDISYQEACKNG